MKNDVLSRYRFDGKGFWHEWQPGRWSPVLPGSVAFRLRMELGVTKREARRLRDEIKIAGDKGGDIEWGDERRWLSFTKGRRLYVCFGMVHFCDPYTGDSKRSMTIAAFNEKLKKEFPHKAEVPPLPA